MLHVTIGPVTVRVEPHAVAVLHGVLATALEVLAADAARTSAPRLRLASSRGDEG